MQIFNGEEIEIPFEKGRGVVDPDNRGKTCFVYRGELLKEVSEKFGRDSEGLCLKIFFNPLEGDIEDYYWGSPWRRYSLKRCEEIGRLSRLVQATTIQNWLWMKDLAPRVYAIVLIERDGKKYPAQLTEFLEGSKYKTNEEVQNQLDVIEKELAKFKCKYAHRELINRNDFLGGKVIDLQGFRWTGDTKEAVRKWVEEVGRYGKASYQDVNEMGIVGKPRNTEKRIKAMKLDEIDFKGKSVLDVGCNSGAFCMYAISRGAKRTIGLDLPKQVESAQTLAFYLGHHNIDYIAFDLTGECPLGFQPDITFFLSMNIHIGLPEWIPNQTKELMVFEENAKQSKFKPDYWQKELSKYFASVVKRGTTNDQNKEYHKPIFWCRKVLK